MSFVSFVVKPSGDHFLLNCRSRSPIVNRSVVGLRTIIGDSTELNRVVILGSDYYESQASVERHESQGLPRMGIGAGCQIDNAIIDKNARIGNGVKISAVGKPENVDHELYFVRDGVVIIPKDAIIPHGTVI